MTETVIKTFQEKIKATKKNFFAIRIFSAVNKDAMADTELEDKCRAGTEILAKNTYKTYLPMLDPKDAVKREDFRARS